MGVPWPMVLAKGRALLALLADFETAIRDNLLDIPKTLH